MNSLLMNEIFENTLNEEHDKRLLMKIQFRRKLFSTQCDMEIKDFEIKNSECALIDS